MNFVFFLMAYDELLYGFSLLDAHRLNFVFDETWQLFFIIMFENNKNINHVNDVDDDDRPIYRCQYYNT